ncbi:hypothetical protein MTO96_046731 [Rhipicephalus appendiculatus]
MADTFHGNSATQNGKASEQKDLDMYLQMTEAAMTRVKIVVHPDLPLLGYSPDGIIFNIVEPDTLPEIRSPVLGKTKPSIDLAQGKKLLYVKSGENIVPNTARVKYIMTCIPSRDDSDFSGLTGDDDDTFQTVHPGLLQMILIHLINPPKRMKTMSAARTAAQDSWTGVIGGST